MSVGSPPVTAVTPSASSREAEPFLLDGESRDVPGAGVGDIAVPAIPGDDCPACRALPRHDHRADWQESAVRPQPGTTRLHYRHQLRTPQLLLSQVRQPPLVFLTVHIATCITPFQDHLGILLARPESRRPSRSGDSPDQKQEQNDPEEPPERHHHGVIVPRSHVHHLAATTTRLCSAATGPASFVASRDSFTKRSQWADRVTPPSSSSLVRQPLFSRRRRCTAAPKSMPGTSRSHSFQGGPGRSCSN